jgi:phosphotransferase system  glucose/maltose/N-acetylglucosamine-specific IIC component
MRLTRFALGAGVVVVVVFMLLVAIGMHGAFTPIIIILALGGLIACGNLLYGKHSHGAAATARVRPAQEAQNRAIDEARRAAAAPTTTTTTTTTTPNDEPPAP